MLKAMSEGKFCPDGSDKFLVLPAEIPDPSSGQDAVPVVDSNIPDGSNDFSALPGEVEGRESDVSSEASDDTNAEFHDSSSDVSDVELEAGLCREVSNLGGVDLCGDLRRFRNPKGRTHLGKPGFSFRTLCNRDASGWEVLASGPNEPTDDICGNCLKVELAVIKRSKDSLPDLEKGLAFHLIQYCAPDGPEAVDD